MAESIREVLERRQQQKQQNSQQSKPAKVEEEVLDEDEVFEEEEVVETPKKPIETQRKPENKASEEQQIAMNIELLQNDGRFRAEILYQIQEMNKALVVIAGTLVDFTKK